MHRKECGGGMINLVMSSSTILQENEGNYYWIQLLIDESILWCNILNVPPTCRFIVDIADVCFCVASCDIETEKNNFMLIIFKSVAEYTSFPFN